MYSTCILDKKRRKILTNYLGISIWHLLWAIRPVAWSCHHNSSFVLFVP